MTDSSVITPEANATFTVIPVNVLSNESVVSVAQTATNTVQQAVGNLGLAVGSPIATLISIAAAVKGGYDAVKQNPSLSRYVKDLILSSRVFVDGSIMHDSPVNEILKTFRGLYMCFIMTTININTSIGIRNVKDVIQTVSTEGFNDYIAQVEDLAETAKLGNKIYDLLTSNETMTPEDANTVKDAISTSKDGVNATQAYNDNESRQFKGSVKPVEFDPSLPNGTMMTIDLKNNEGKVGASVQLLVRVLPYIVAKDLVVELIKLDTVTSFAKRFVMWRAGELRFWRDLVFSFDKVAQRQKAVKQDQTGIVMDFINETMVREKRAMGRVVNMAAQKQYVEQNVANAMMIFSREAVDRAKEQTGFDLMNATHRDKYFAKTLSMIIAVVDPMFRRVDIFIDGIDQKATYTFDMFKGKSQSMTPEDLLSVVTVLSQGRAPRF